MSVKKMSVGLLGLLASLGLAQAHAQAPNYYECHGKNISLKFFDHSNINNSTELTLNLGKSSYTVDDTGIETQTTVMGEVKSLVIKILPDVEVKKASFIMPKINLGTNSLGEVINQVTFSSQLAITTIATPFIGTPYVGIVNKSKYFDLICKASQVMVPL